MQKEPMTIEQTSKENKGRIALGSMFVFLGIPLLFFETSIGGTALAVGLVLILVGRGSCVQWRQGHQHGR